MRIFRCCIFCLMTAVLSFAQKEDWQPITPQDLQIKEVPGNPGAPAIKLYYADYIDDSAHSEFLYERVKILNDKGMKYADVEIQCLRAARSQALRHAPSTRMGRSSSSVASLSKRRSLRA